MSQSWDALEPSLLKLYSDGRIAELAEFLRGLEPEPAWEARARTLLGCSLAALGRPAEALAAFERAAALSPSDPLVLSNLGQALRASGQEEHGTRRLRLALDRNPGDLRQDRLLLHAQPADWSGWLPMTAGPSRGHLLPSFLPFGPFDAPRVALQSDRSGTWTLRLEARVPLPPSGAPVLAAVWNDAGLHLKSGPLSIVQPGEILAVSGPDARRIQRRGFLRVLAGDFVQARREGAGRLELCDVSACGLSYYAAEPPPPGERADYALSLLGQTLQAPGVVRGTRDTPSGRRIVAVQLQSDERTRDRLARTLQEHRRRLHQATRLLPA